MAKAHGRVGRVLQDLIRADVTRGIRVDLLSVTICPNGSF